MTLANIDPRLLGALRAIRVGEYSYTRGVSTPPDLLTSFSKDLGYPAAWGDPAQLPAFGGLEAERVWKSLGVTSRTRVGGIPCELVHGTVTGGSCTANAGIRGLQAFAEAVALYLPVSEFSAPFVCRLTVATGSLPSYRPYEASQAARNTEAAVHPALCCS